MNKFAQSEFVEANEFVRSEFLDLNFSLRIFFLLSSVRNFGTKIRKTWRLYEEHYY